MDKISENLFLDIKPDIFLSHSHADEDDVIRLAILIEKELNLSVFIVRGNGIHKSLPKNGHSMYQNKDGLEIQMIHYFFKQTIQVEV